VKSWGYKPARDLDLPPGQRLSSPARESGLISATARLGWWALLRGYLAVAHRMKVNGRDRLPSAPPFVLAANHASHLDALALSMVVPARLRERVLPIAAGDTFFETPSATVFASILMNALPIWRHNCGRHALKQLRDRLIEEPCAYILFPEGTRSRDGRMASFKPGLGMLVAGTPAPVVPCWIEGAFQAWPPQRKWPRAAKLSVRIGTPLRFESVANDRGGWSLVARQVEDAVRQLGGAGDPAPPERRDPS
jgi:1-acyl-sn-glycerol-3-phosphate acyltransferase